jgi:formate dehydrogenase subunit gamma
METPAATADAPEGLDAALDACDGIEGPLLPILHRVQAAYGHIPDAAVPAIAARLNLGRAEVHGVISFYHDFRTTPPGRHVMKLCRSEACQALGADALAAHAEARLGVGVLPRAVRLRPCGDGRRPAGRRVDAARLDELIDTVLA